MKTFFALFVATTIGLTWCSQSHATIITSVVAGANGPGITFGAASFNQVVAGNGSTPGPSVNTITLNATLESGYVPNSPFNWMISFVEADGDVNINGNTKYLVTVNLTNNGVVAPGVTDQQFALGTVAETLNLFGSTSGPNSFTSPSSPSPTSSIGLGGSSGTTVNFSNVTPFNPGDSAILTFTLDVADYTNLTNTSVVSGNFMLSMIANPEPASLALAGFALSASGAGVFIRRKKKAVAPVTEETPVV